MLDAELKHAAGSKLTRSVAASSRAKASAGSTDLGERTDHREIKNEAGLIGSHAPLSLAHARTHTRTILTVAFP